MSFEALKQRHAAAWGAAPLERAAETAAEVHDDLVASLAPNPGSGGSTWRPPALVMIARELAAAEGLDVHLEVGDAERLSCGEASFDVVASAQGSRCSSPWWPNISLRRLSA